MLQTYRSVIALRAPERALAAARGRLRSGGKWHSPATIRALLKAAPILIRDETTNVLEAVTEAATRRRSSSWRYSAPPV